MKFFTILFFLCFSASITAKELKKVTFHVDEWCPYNCDQEMPKKGYVVDIVKKIFGDAGYEVDVKIVTWSRAISDLIKGKSDVIFGLGYGGVFDEEVLEARKDISDKEAVKAVNDEKISTVLGAGSQEFFALKSEKIKWDYSRSIAENSKNFMLGIQQDYDYGEEIMDYLASNPKGHLTIAGDDPLARLMKMADKGRINLIPEDKNAFLSAASALNRADDFESVFDQPDSFKEDSDLLLVFSPKDKKRSQKLNQIVHDGLSKIRKNGELKKILDKYGLKDWKD